MAATGKIFRFGGILVLITFHLMTVAKQYWNLSDVYFLILATTLFYYYETWGPRLSDARVCVNVQCGLQCAGHLLL